MLTTEWKLEKAKKVWRREAREEGREEGHKEGHKEGREEASEEIARNALAEGLSLDIIHNITGLDPEHIKKLSTTK